MAPCGFGAVYTKDAFGGTPLPCEPEQASCRPSFCIRTVDGHSTPHLVNTAIRALLDKNHTVALNYLADLKKNKTPVL